MSKVREILIKIKKKFFPKKERIVEGVIPEKLAIIIDGENLWKALQIDLGGLEIGDFREFENRLLNLVERGELARPSVYYTSVDLNAKNPKTILRVFARLADAGYEVKSKPLPKGKEPKSEIDPLIAVDICRAALNSDVSTIVLLSGDHHFVEAIMFAQERGKKVIVVSATTSLSAELKKVSDEWIDLKSILPGITQKSKIEKKREEALEKLGRRKKIELATLKETP